MQMKWFCFYLCFLFKNETMKHGFSRMAQCSKWSWLVMIPTTIDLLLCCCKRRILPCHCDFWNRKLMKKNELFRKTQFVSSQSHSCVRKSSQFQVLAQGAMLLQLYLRLKEECWHRSRRYTFVRHSPSRTLIALLSASNAAPLLLSESPAG